MAGEELLLFHLDVWMTSQLTDSRLRTSSLQRWALESVLTRQKGELLTADSSADPPVITTTDCELQVQQASTVALQHVHAVSGYFAVYGSELV